MDEVEMARPPKAALAGDSNGFMCGQSLAAVSILTNWPSRRCTVGEGHGHFHPGPLPGRAVNVASATDRGEPFFQIAKPGTRGEPIRAHGGVTAAGSQAAAIVLDDERKLLGPGYPAAQFNLGVFFEQGQVVEQDFAEAVKWYRLAADQELSDAQSNLGLCYQTGRGVKQNTQEAVKWFIKAARQGNKNAQHNLGLHYAAVESGQIQE